MGALYLASKLEECPVRMRDVINVYDLFLQRDAHVVASHASTTTVEPFEHTPMAYFSDTFYELKDALVVAEMQILKRLAFNVLVVLPYGTLVNYLRLLGLAQHRDACTKAWGFLNDAYVPLSHTRSLTHTPAHTHARSDIVYRRRSTPSMLSPPSLALPSSSPHDISS